MSDIVFSTGDVDPFAFGGGIVLREDVDEYTWIVWGVPSPPEDDGDEDDVEVTYFVIPIPDDVLDQYDYLELDPEDVSDDIDAKRLREMSAGVIDERMLVMLGLEGRHGLSAVGMDDPSTIPLRGLKDWLEVDYDKFCDATKNRPQWDAERLKEAEDALRDHMPELHDSDLPGRDLAMRKSLRRHRDRCAEKVKAWT